MKVDVILPIYKSDNNVFKAIDSVINQTYKNWCLYIVDDASGDDSLDGIKEKYGDYNGKIKYYQLKENRRQAFARNQAISKSNGEYIAFIDQDDVWVMEKLEWQINHIEKHKVDAVHGNLMIINNNDEVILRRNWKKENEGRRLVPWEELTSEELARRIFKKPNIRIVSSLVKRESFKNIGGFKEQFFGGEDETFWFEMALNCKIRFIDKVLFFRRNHEANTVNIFRVSRLKGYLKSLRFIKKEYKSFIKRELIVEKSFNIYRNLISHSYHKKQYFSFFYYLSIIFVNYPIKLIKHSFSILQK